MYIRFEAYHIDNNSRKCQGIFQVAHALMDADEVETYTRDRIKILLAYFNKHLLSPRCLNAIGNRRALSYFKPTAFEMLREMRELVAIIQDHGVHVKICYKRELTNILYEDTHQVVAFR